MGARLVSVPNRLAQAADKPETVAQAAAEQWLALVDGGKFDESWTAAAELFQAGLDAV